MEQQYTHLIKKNVLHQSFFIKFHVEVLKGREINLDTTFFYFSFPEIIN